MNTLFMRLLNQILQIDHILIGVILAASQY